MLWEVVRIFPFNSVLLDALDAVFSVFLGCFMPRKAVLFVPFNDVPFDASLRFVPLDTT